MVHLSIDLFSVEVKLLELTADKTEKRVTFIRNPTYRAKQYIEVYSQFFCKRLAVSIKQTQVCEL